MTLSLLLAAGLLSTSCVNEEEDLFDKSAAERLNEIKTVYSARLEAQPAGWAMQYYPTDDAEVPYGNGYLILCDFNPDHSVRIAMRNAFTGGAYKEETSIWEIITDNGPVLSFNTYNSLFHIFSSPEDVASTDDDETGTGIGGDYEFVVVDAPEDASYMMLKGKKRGTYNLLTPLEEGTDFEEYLTDVNKFTGTMFSADAPNRLYMWMNDKAYGFDEASTTIPLVYEDGLDPVVWGERHHFLMTKRYDDYYLRFRDAITLDDGSTVQDFHYDPALDRFVSTENSDVYIYGESSAQFFNTSLNNGRRWEWKRTSDMSDYAKTLFDNVFNQFKDEGFNLQNMCFINNENGLILRVQYRQKQSTSSAFYRYNLTENGENINISYQGPDGEGAQNILNAIPALADYIQMLNGEFHITGTASNFNLSDMKISSVNNPDIWLAMSYN